MREFEELYRRFNDFSEKFKAWCELHPEGAADFEAQDPKLLVEAVKAAAVPKIQMSAGQPNTSDLEPNSTISANIPPECTLSETPKLSEGHPRSQIPVSPHLHPLGGALSWAGDTGRGSPAASGPPKPLQQVKADMSVLFRFFAPK